MLRCSAGHVGWIILVCFTFCVVKDLEVGPKTCMASIFCQFSLKIGFLCIVLPVRLSREVAIVDFLRSVHALLFDMLEI